MDSTSYCCSAVSAAIAFHLFVCGLTPTFFSVIHSPMVNQHILPSSLIYQEQVFGMAYYSQRKSGASISVEDNTLQLSSEWSPGLDPNDLRELQAAQHDPTKIISELPKEAARLGYYSTICLIFNRMIGVGIFNSASVVFTNTKSIGFSLVLWSIGAVMTLGGVFVFVELGLTIPRWPFGNDGEKRSAIRSGDGLNYFNYMLKRPIFLATCMYGITFIILENTAGTSVSFATNILDACHVTQTPGKIIGIALAVNTFCCVLHTLSRKWGILLNNFFGTLKLCILIFIIIIGIVWINHDIASINFDPKTSFQFDNSPRLPYRYAEAFLYVILPFGAFHQINYVAAEVRNPRKVFPRTSFAGVITVIVIYMAVNILYAAIIPKDQLFKDGGIDVLAAFMKLTIGHVMTNQAHLVTFYSILKAISAFGGLIVVTFTTARVKQEIAKEGILPYSLFFAESYDISLSRLSSRKSKPGLIPIHREKTPAATLGLHWIITTILVIVPVVALQPVPYSTGPAYSYLTTAFIYNIDVVYFFFIALGVLCLWFTPSVRWAEKSQLQWPIVSVLSASTLLVCCAFPMIFLWVPDPKFPKATKSGNLVQWWSGQTLAVSFLAFAFLYWFMFRIYIRVRAAREGKTLHVKRDPIFKHDKEGLTQVFEIVTLQWKRDIGMRLGEIDGTDDGYRESTILSSPPPNGNGRLSPPSNGWESRADSGFRGSNSTHELVVQQPRSAIRRKPVMTELVA